MKDFIQNLLPEKKMFKTSEDYKWTTDSNWDANVKGYNQGIADCRLALEKALESGLLWKAKDWKEIGAYLHEIHPSDNKTDKEVDVKIALYLNSLAKAIVKLMRGRDDHKGNNQKVS